MTDTRFAVGPTTAYLTDRVLAIGGEGSVDAAAMTLCATADWSAIMAHADEHRLVAVVLHEGDRVRVAVIGAAGVVVATIDGDRHFEGGENWTIDAVERAHQVTLTGSRSDEPADPTYRTDGGAVPAAFVSRRLGAPLVAPPDPFDAMFGHTVERSVEAAAVRPTEQAAGSSVGGVLVFSTGERVVLDSDIVLGRNPRSSTGDTARRARLVKVSHPSVSRRHVAIHLDHRLARIEDLGSTNGTTLTVPGASPRTLHGGAPFELPVGAFVDLGGDVSFSVEEAA